MKHNVFPFFAVISSVFFSCTPLDSNSSDQSNNGSSNVVQTRKIKETVMDVFTIAGKNTQVSSYEYNGDLLSRITTTSDGAMSSKQEYAYETRTTVQNVFSFVDGNWKLDYVTTDVYLDDARTKLMKRTTDMTVSGTNSITETMYEYNNTGLLSTITKYTNDEAKSKYEYTYSGKTGIIKTFIYVDGQWQDSHIITNTYADDGLTKITESVISRESKTSTEKYEYEGDDLKTILYYTGDKLSAKREYVYNADTKVETYSLLISGEWTVYYIITTRYLEE